MRLGALALWLSLALSLVAAPSGASGALVPSGYRLVAAEFGIPTHVFYAVALAESGRPLKSSSLWRPWPWTLNIEGDGQFFATRRAAQSAFAAAMRQGLRSIDVGLMQVNWRHHHEKLDSPKRALDPYHNLRVGAAILYGCFQSRGDWWSAVGCYHAPADQQRANGYRKRVHRIWRRLSR